MVADHIGGTLGPSSGQSSCSDSGEFKKPPLRLGSATRQSTRQIENDKSLSLCLGRGPNVLDPIHMGTVETSSLDSSGGLEVGLDPAQANSGLP